MVDNLKYTLYSLQVRWPQIFCTKLNFEHKLKGSVLLQVRQMEHLHRLDMRLYKLLHLSISKKTVHRLLAFTVKHESFLSLWAR